MEQGESHKAQSGDPGPPRGDQGRTQLPRGAVAHENEGQHDLVGREPQQKAREDGPVQAEEPAYGVKQTYESGEQGGVRRVKDLVDFEPGEQMLLVVPHFPEHVRSLKS